MFERFTSTLLRGVRRAAAAIALAAAAAGAHAADIYITA